MSTRVFERNGLYVTAVAAAGGAADRRRLEFCTMCENRADNPHLDTAEVRALLVQLSNWLWADPKFDAARKISK